MQQENERNYHIFYMLAKACPPELKKKLNLYDDYKWNYLNEKYDRYDDFELKDISDYSEMLVNMNGLKFTQRQQDEIFDIVGAV